MQEYKQESAVNSAIGDSAECWKRSAELSALDGRTVRARISGMLGNAADSGHTQLAYDFTYCE